MSSFSLVQSWLATSSWQIVSYLVTQTHPNLTTVLWSRAHCYKAAMHRTSTSWPLLTTLLTSSQLINYCPRTWMTAPAFWRPPCKNCSLRLSGSRDRLRICRLGRFRAEIAKTNTARSGRWIDTFASNTWKDGKAIRSYYVYCCTYRYPPLAHGVSRMGHLCNSTLFPSWYCNLTSRWPGGWSVRFKAQFSSYFFQQSLELLVHRDSQCFLFSTAAAKMTD